MYPRPSHAGPCDPLHRHPKRPGNRTRSWPSLKPGCLPPLCPAGAGCHRRHGQPQAPPAPGLVIGAAHTDPRDKLAQVASRSGHLPSEPQGEARAGASGPQDGRQVMPDTGECFGGYFYLENILLQQVGMGGQGVLGPRPLEVAEDRGPWEPSTRVAIRDCSVPNLPSLEHVGPKGA